MKTRKLAWIGMALGVMLLWGAGARADFITYLAGGIFTGGTTPGTPTYTAPTDPGTTVTYTTTISTATFPPATQVSLGTFTAASGAATPVALGGLFDLTILNTATGHSILFVGTVGGTLTATTSTGFVQFAGPLTQKLDNALFTILSADSNVPGRVNLGAPTTNGGMTTINGLVNAVPEPSSLVLLGLGGPALAGLAYRRARRRAEASPAT